LGGGFSHTVNGNTVSFTSLAVNSSGQLWDFGDGNQGSGPAPVHTYAGTGSYTVVMRSFNICGDTITSSQVVVTCTKPAAEWTAQILSSGGAGMRVQFNATPWSSADAVNFQWLFGDGTNGSGANPIKTYGVPFKQLDSTNRRRLPPGTPTRRNPGSGSPVRAMRPCPWRP
jgi:PKD repeat protein